MNQYDLAITGWLWMAQIVAGGYLFAIVVCRGCWRDCPMFSLYVALTLGIELVKFYVATCYYGSLYFWTYWIGSLVTTIVLFGVIGEVLKSAFKTACSVFGNHLTKLFTVAGIVALFIAVFSYQLSAEPTLDELVRRLDRAAALLLLATFGFTALISNRFGLVWKPQTYGIALGFLFYYGVSAFITTLMSLFHFAVPALNAFNVLTFLITEGVWIGYLGPNRERRSISRAEIAASIEAWEQVT